MSSKMLSLYDYLGRPAGKALGWAVGRQASLAGVDVQKRHVENKAYTGWVNLYNEEVLKVFFKNPSNKAIIDADEKAYREMQIRRKIWGR